MSKLVLVLVALLPVLAQPKAISESVPSVQYVPRAIYDSMQYRNQQDIEGLTRDLAAYKELSFKAMDTSGTHLNIFIIAVVTLLLIVGVFNFTASARERKNIQEALERQFEDKIKQNMNEFLEEYEVIKSRSAAIVASREEDKKTLRVDLEEFSKNQINSATSDALSQINEDLGEHKSVFEEEMAKFHLSRMEKAKEDALVRPFIDALKSYIHYSEMQEFGGKHNHTIALELLGELLNKTSLIGVSEKDQVKTILDGTDLFDDQAKALALDILDSTRVFNGLSALTDATGKLKELLEEKKKGTKTDDAV